MQDELLRQRLYRIFRLEDENYMYTMKVMYIYRWVEVRAGDTALDVVTALCHDIKKHKNTEKVDALFRQMQAVNMAKYAPPARVQPPQRQVRYSSGWKIG